MIKDTDLINKAKNYAIKSHTLTNHMYDIYPYYYHLNMVANNGKKYSKGFSASEKEIIIGACWCHDIIEDTRESYNDIARKVGIEIADIVFILTNEKGKTRAERANEKYFFEIKKNKSAVFVKLCDRLANLQYSHRTKSHMYEVYLKEHYDFKEKLYIDGVYNELWHAIEEFLKK